MNKIAVVGISGSGKSVLARQLGEKLDLPVIHMDKLFWKGNWEAVSESEYLYRHAELAKQEKWIIEGYIDAKMADRAKMADLVIYLDYPGFLCAWRVFTRWLKHRKKSRPELAGEAREKLDFRFLWRVLSRGERGDTENALKDADQSKVFRFHSPRAVNSFIQRTWS